MKKSTSVGRIFMDSFSGGAADLKPANRTPNHVLVALSQDPRVSTFDLSEKPWLCGCISILMHDGLIVEDKSEPYPWHRYAITASAHGITASKDIKGDV